jgi:hypothetical protein
MPIRQGYVIGDAQEQNESAWVPSATHTAELVNVIRDNHLRLCGASRPTTLFEGTPPPPDLRRIVRPHRSPYPTRHELRLQLSRCDSGELPH